MIKMKSVRCSGYRSDNKRCAKRVFPEGSGHGWCSVHIAQMPRCSAPKYESKDTSDNIVRCDICFDDMSILENANFECGHFFHISCAKNLRDPRCPVCRSPIKSSSLTKLDVTKIQERCLNDQHERDSQFIEPANFDENMESDEYDNDDDDDNDIDVEFEFELGPETTVPQLYQKLINDYSIKDLSEIPIMTVIITIIGSITVMSHIMNITIPQELCEWLMTDLAELYPDEDQDQIYETINIFI